MFILPIFMLVYASSYYVVCEKIYIVTSTIENCPHNLDIDRCLTLQQYASNLTINTREDLSLEMEPGYHWLNTSISLIGRRNNSFALKAVNETAHVLCNRQLVGSFYVKGRLGAGYFHSVHISGVNFINCDQNIVYYTTKAHIEDVHYKYSRQFALTLYSVSNATISRSSISDFACTGFCSVKALVVTNSSLYLNMCTFFNSPPSSVGGGIKNDMSDIIIENSSFRDISGRNGGAISITNSRNRTVAIINSTFYGNNAKERGGAIYVDSADITIKGCEFTNNTANAGAIFATGINISLTVSHSKFSSNMAKVSGGAVFITDGITSFPHIADALYPNTHTSLAITASKFENNKAQRNGGAIAVFGRRNDFSLSNGRFVNNTVFNTDRTGRGGAVLIASPNSTTLIEKSEFIRNKAYMEGGAIDITRKSCQTLVRMSTFTENVAHLGSGGAIANPFTTNTFNNSITIDKSTFNRNNASYCGALDVIQATVISSIFTNNRATPVPRAKRNWKTAGGAAICVRENTSKVLNSTFQQNIAIDSSGGAINTFTGVRIKNSVFDRNMAGREGGVILHHSGNLSIIRSNFSKNQCTTSGGAVNGVSVHIEDVNFSNNMARFGGSLYILQAIIKNSNFIHNKATNDGGAVFFYKCTFCGTKASSIQLSNFTNNGARKGVGGSIALTSHNLSLIRNIFSYNWASSCGAIQAHSHNVNISKNLFIQNRAAGGINSGGGVMCLRSGSVLVYDSQFIQNTATQHGGVMEVDNSTVLIEGSMFDNNTARNYGGVAYTSSYHSQATFEVVESSFASNQASMGDGGVFHIHSEGSKIDVYGSNFSYNYAGHYGGLFSVKGINLKVNHSSVFNNMARKGDTVSTCNGNITISNSGTYNISQRRQADDCFFYDIIIPLIIKPSATLSPTYSTVLESTVTSSDITFAVSKIISTSTYHSLTSLSTPTSLTTSLDQTATTTYSHKTKTVIAETVVTSTLYPRTVTSPTSLSISMLSTYTYDNTVITTNDGVKLCAPFIFIPASFFPIIISSLTLL